MSDTYWTAAELARFFVAPLGTVYRWASEDDWPSSDPHKRPVYYSLQAATASATRRRAESD